MGALAALCARGRKAYPKLRVEQEAFGRCLERALDGESAAQVDSLAVEDLYLACACSEAVQGAAGVFERKFQNVFRRAIARVLKDPSQRQDAEQRLLQHLLVAEPGRPPRISEYLGRASLESWVSVAAVRVAISFGRQANADRRLEIKALVDVSAADPERLLMKEEVRVEVGAAVAAAISHLGDRERLALRLFLVSGMSATAIGKALGVTQQAVSKYLSKARESLRVEVCAALKKSLKLRGDDFASLLRVVDSQLDVSIGRALAEGDL